MRRLLALAVILVAAGCGPNLEAGEVVGRSYDDPDTWSTMECQWWGKNGCSFWGWEEHHDGPHWYLKLRDAVDGETVTDDVEVPESLYDTCRIDWRYPECRPR